MYDFVIIGAGPSGSTLARLLGELKKYKILLLDIRDLDKKPNNKVKACGGLLSHHAQKEIAKLSLTLPSNILESNQFFAVQTIDLDNNITRYYQRDYLNMNRELFDRYLVSLVNKDVNKVFGATYKNSTKKDNYYEIKYIKDNKVYSVNTKYIVGADGANSKVRKEFFNKVRLPKKYITIQKWYKMNTNNAYYVGLFDKRITDYYSWSIQKGEYLVLGGAFLDDANNRFNLLKEKYEKYYNIKLNKEERIEGTHLFRPTNINSIYFGNSNIFLIGEASGAVSPTSGEGFSYAFRTAYYLKEAILKDENNIVRTYKKKCFKIKVEILMKLIKSIGMYNTFVRKLILKSKILSIK